MQVHRTEDMDWEAIAIEGVSYKTLRQNNGVGGGGTTIVEMARGSKYPPHSHPGREQAIVLKGCLRVGGVMLNAGDYWVSEAGEVHDAEALEDTQFFVITDKTVELI